MSSTLTEVLKPFRMLVTVIWFGLLTALPTYVVVATMVSRGGDRPEPDTTLAMGFTAAAALMAVASLLVTRFYPSAATIANAMSGPADPEALARDSESGKVNDVLAAKIRQLDAAERKVLMLRPLFQLQLIIRCALAEGVGVLGFVLVLQGHEVGTMIPFAAASFVLMLLAFPRFDRFAERATATPPA